MSQRVSDDFLLVVLFKRTMACGTVSEDSGHSAVRQTPRRYETLFLNAVVRRRIAYHLSYLMSVVVQFEPAWSRAFLRRCRFLDSEFQGEMLAVISKFRVSEHPLSLTHSGKLSLGLISTALRSGTPIPQITPCPLLDRFLRYNHGLDVVREAEDELVLPNNDELLEDEQYMYGVFPSAESCSRGF